MFCGRHAVAMGDEDRPHHPLLVLESLSREGNTDDWISHFETMAPLFLTFLTYHWLVSVSLAWVLCKKKKIASLTKIISMTFEHDLYIRTRI